MAEPCTRWDAEGRLARERGETLDAHFAACPDCLAARAADAALTARLVETGARWQPPGDWEARVFARIAREAPARRFSWWYALFPALAAAGLAVFFFAPRGGGGPGSPDPSGAGFEVQIGVVDGAQVVRSENPKPGDTLRLTARVPTRDPARVAIRIYRDDRTLIFACGGGEVPCSLADDAVRAEVLMTAPGAYRSIILTGAGPLPAPAGTLDADAAAARAAGASVTLGEAVRVW